MENSWSVPNWIISWPSVLLPSASQEPLKNRSSKPLPTRHCSRKSSVIHPPCGKSIGRTVIEEINGQTNVQRLLPFELDTGYMNMPCFALLSRSFTDLGRSHSLFSVSTPAFPNSFLIFKSDVQWTPDTVELHVKNQLANMFKQDYKRNTWQSVCGTWDGRIGLVQLWLDGRPSARKYSFQGTIESNSLIILGQVVLSINTYCTIYRYNVCSFIY